MSSTAGTSAVLLVNTGTPQAPTRRAVHRFLSAFLSDRRVVELPRLLWWPLLHALVLPLRSGRSAQRYAQIWREQGAPLQFLTAQLRAELERELQRTDPSLRVEAAYLYSPPAVAAVMAQLRAASVRHLIVLPLYPQASSTSTGAVCDQVGTALRRWRTLPDLHFMAGYHADADYIAALAAQLQEHCGGRGHGDSHLLISFHGIPQAYAARGDRYAEQCRQTAALLAAALGLAPQEWSLCFQSRFGAARWLTPATDRCLRELPRRGQRAVTVICPGFAVDCLETLEEIALVGRAQFFSAGGERFEYVPALNAGPAHVRLLSKLIRRALDGWAPEGPQAEDMAPGTRALGGA